MDPKIGVFDYKFSFLLMLVFFSQKRLFYSGDNQTNCPRSNRTNNMNKSITEENSILLLPSMKEIIQPNVPQFQRDQTKLIGRTKTSGARNFGFTLLNAVKMSGIL